MKQIEHSRSSVIHLRLAKIVLIIALIVQGTAGFAKEKNLNLNLRDIKLSEAMEYIESTSDYKFFYTPESIDTNLKVEVDLENSDIKSVLNEMLKDSGITYLVDDMQVVLFAKKLINDQQESVKITGNILDASGSSLPGVNVVVKGTANGCTSNLDGKYSIEVSESNPTLIFSFIGFTSQEVQVNGKKTIDVVLQEEAFGLNEVIVVGFQTQKKVNLTGSVSTVKGDEVTKRPVGKVSAALQGITPGVTVVQNSGIPGGDGGTIRVRGIGTLNNANALVLVDGIAQGMDDIDPNDIESISILKDASSASIYGARAANGVILITTKRAKAGKMSVELNSYAGTQNFTYAPDYVSTEQYMNMVNEACRNSGYAEKYTEEYIQNTILGIDPIKYPDTDWRKSVMASNAFQQNHSIRVSGGNDKARVAVSLGYMDQDGLIQNTNMKRYNFRTNADLNVTDKLKLSADINLRRTSTDRPYEGIWSIFKTMNRMKPTIMDKYPDGTYGFLVGDNYNPLAMTEKSGYDNADYDQVVSNFKVDYEVLDGLTLKGVAAVKYNSDFTKKFKNEQTFYDYYSKNVVGTVGPNYSENNFGRSLQITTQAYLDYKKSFGNHQLGALLGVSQITSEYNYLKASRDNFPSNNINEINGGSTANDNTEGYTEEWAMRSVFARVNYSFKDRYLLEANIRHDGSSHFTEDNRYGTFPSFSAGWRMSEESFLKDIDMISNLKMRASWGQLGNHGTDRYPTVSSYELGKNYPFGGSINSGAAMTVLANRSLIWEETEESNIGVDLSLWDGLIDMTADVYSRKTSGIIWDLPIPNTIGLDAPKQNACVVTNKGWELSLTHNNKIGDFKYSIGFNLSDVNNKVDDLKDGTKVDGYKVKMEGEAIDSYYGYVADGLFQSDAEVAAHATQNPATGAGDIRYKDLNNDGKIDDNDKAIIGSQIPKYSYGINLNLEYKGWDLSMFLQGVGEVDRYVSASLAEGVNSANNAIKANLDYWTPENTDASNPRLLYWKFHNYKESSFWVKNASYLRLKNIQLGYNFKKGQVLGLEKVRIYMSGQNLLTFTDFKYGDPEISDDRGAYYPQVKTVTLGVNVKF